MRLSSLTEAMLGKASASKAQEPIWMMSSTVLILLVVTFKGQHGVVTAHAMSSSDTRSDLAARFTATVIIGSCIQSILHQFFNYRGR